MRKLFKYLILDMAAVLAFSSFALAQNPQSANQNRNAAAGQNSPARQLMTAGVRPQFMI